MTDQATIRHRRGISDGALGLLLMLPALLVLLIVVAFPILKAIYASFCTYGLTELRK